MMLKKCRKMFIFLYKVYSRLRDYLEKSLNANLLVNNKMCILKCVFKFVKFLKLVRML